MKNKPTTGDMMIAFVECYIPGADVREMSALFDEWIAGVRAKAWSEGWSARASRGYAHLKVGECVPPPAHINPYRKAVR